MNDTLTLLKKLTSTPAVSGDEENIVSLLCELLEPYGEITVDCMNNVFCTFGDGYHFMLDAHIDEIGFTVTEITDDGFLKFSNGCNIDARLLPASEVSVWGRREVKGIISTLPPHLQNADDEKCAPDIKHLAVDTGYSKQQLCEIVSPGDKITFKKNFNLLLNNRLSASCLDDRSGVCAVLNSLERLKKLPCKITVLFSSQEEVGLRGAKIGPYLKNVDEALSIDVSFAQTPNCNKEECGEISKGAMIGFSPILDKNISKKLVCIAEKNKIKYQREIMSGRTGTNADVISLTQNGIKSALISIPEKYMHQSVEVVDINDINAVTDLLCAYIAERSAEINA